MLKPSPAYAHLQTATDEAAMRPIFQAHLSRLWDHPVHIENFHIPRVIPKGNGRYLIQYRFSTLEENGSYARVFFGRLLAPSEMIPDFAKEPDAFFIADIRLVVPVFPYDPKLKTLAQFFDAAERVQLLQPLTQAIHLNGTARIAKVDVLGYRLERRGILYISISEHDRTVSLIAKLVRPEKASELFGRLQELEENGFGPASGENIRVPHPIALTPEGVLWLEAVSDPSLHDLIETNHFIPGCRSAGLALKKLQIAQLKSLPIYTSDEALTQLKGLTDETAEIYPALKEHLQKIFHQAEKTVPTIEKESMQPVHRDFYDKQLLVGPKRVTLLDTDTLTLGDPALDAGNFLAHLFLRGKQHSLSNENTSGAQTAFVENYRVTKDGETRKEFWKRAAWWEKTALLRLACLYSLRPRWKKLAFPVLEQAEKLTKI